MTSLQDQFLKAGLVDKKKLKQAHHEKAAQKKQDRRSGTPSVDETRQAAIETQRKNAERARELNARRNEAAAHKALAAQIAQMVQQFRQSKGKGACDIAYNFTHDNKIKRVFVSAEVKSQLIAGHLVIVCHAGATELVPKVVANKIAERDPSIVVWVKKAADPVDPDDPYADFQIPDDFTW